MAGIIIILYKWIKVNQESSLHSARVSVTMDLDSEVVDWLDALSKCVFSSGHSVARNSPSC